MASLVQAVATYYICAFGGGAVPTPVSFGKDAGKANLTSGNTVVVIAALWISDNAPVPSSFTCTLADNLGNTYQMVDAGSGPRSGSSASVNTFVWISQNNSGGNPTFSMAFSPTSGTAGGLANNLNFQAVAYEYAGLLDSAYDVSATTVYPSQISPVSGLTPGSIHTTSLQEVVIAFAYQYQGNAITLTLPGSEWTYRGGSVVSTSGPATTILECWDQETASLGSYDPSFAETGAGGNTLGDMAVGVVALRISPVYNPPIISLSYQPGFFDIQDSVLACGQPLADYDLLKISYNSKLAVCRPELFFMGYYTDGATIPLPVSPLDAYAYSVVESLYFLGLASSKPPLPGFTDGQETFPALNYTGQPVNGFLVDPYELEPNFGTLTRGGFSTEKQLTLTSQFYEHGNVSTDVPEQAYSSGVSGVYCFGQRQSAQMSPILPGSTYQLESSPAFYDYPDSAIYDGTPITDQMLQAISRNAKLGIFRFEIFFMGYYTNGNTVPAPIGAGNYQYGYNECIFIPLMASSRQPTGDFVPGQVYFPQLANLDVYAYPASAWPEQLSVSSTGQVTCTINGASGVEGQGSVAVYCLAQRYPGLTMAAQPTFADIPDSDMVGGQIPTVGLLQQLNNNAKFGIVATEAFWLGYYEDGNTLAPPTSPVDGYQYANHETLFIPVWVSSRKADSLTFSPGQKTWPSLAGDAWSGYIVASPYECYVNQYKSPYGQLTATMYGGDNGVTDQGIVSMYAICSRQQNITGTTL